jgi:hypothetical protein
MTVCSVRRPRIPGPAQGRGPVCAYGGGMTDETNAEALKKELADLDAQIAELRRLDGDAQARRGSDGDRSAGIIEPEEQATELTGIAENEAVLDILTQRRDALAEKLEALD